MTSRATRGCKAFTLALSLPSTRQVLNWLCRRVFRYNFVLSCKCTCSGQHECPRLKGNGTRSSCCICAVNNCCTLKGERFLDGHEEDAKHESQHLQACWHALHFTHSMPEMVICLAH